MTARGLFSNFSLMKKRIFPIAICLALIVLPIAGCRYFGANPSPPSGLERSIFDVETNLIAELGKRVVTNTVSVPVLVVVTNPATGIVVQGTNEVLVQKFNLIDVTNYHEEYTLTPKTNGVVAVGTQVAGGIANLVVPGLGGTVVAALGGIFGLWAKLRSAKKTAVTLAQGTEVIRNVVQTLPDGANIDSKITAFLQKYQIEAGVLDQVLAILQQQKSSGATIRAEADAMNIASALKTIPATTPKV